MSGEKTDRTVMSIEMAKSKQLLYELKKLYVSQERTCTEIVLQEKNNVAALWVGHLGVEHVVHYVSCATAPFEFSLPWEKKNINKWQWFINNATKI